MEKLALSWQPRCTFMPHASQQKPWLRICQSEQQTRVHTSHSFKRAPDKNPANRVLNIPIFYY